MKSKPILYSFRRCPYAMRARMALLVSGIDFDHREVVLHDKPAAMLAVSPKGTVPVLVLEDGGVIDESIDIMRWALGWSDPQGWLAFADMAKVAAFDDIFKRDLDRYKYWTRYGADPLVHRAAALEMLIEVDAVLVAQAYLGGGSPGFTDMAVFPFVRQFAGVDRNWFETDAPQGVREWLAALTASDLFERAMVRHPRWLPVS